MTRKPSKRKSRLGRGQVAQRRALRKVAQCLTREPEQCPNQARARGLCGTCYQEARRLVRSGEFTWEELEERGLAGRYRGRFRRSIETIRTHNGRNDSRNHRGLPQRQHRPGRGAGTKTLQEVVGQGRAQARKPREPQQQLARKRSA